MGAVEKLRRRTIGIEVMKTKDFTALVWNCCKICDDAKCPIRLRCEHITGGDICIPQKNYLESIYSAALDMLGISMSTREAVRLGVHLIPLYSILFELKIASSSLKSVWEYYGANGDPRINPIYREIREHMKVIDNMWASLGYKQLVGHGSSLEGDSSYCDNMFSEV